jgi:hypothetical protein
MSLLVFLAIISLFIYKVKIMAGRDDTTIKKNSLLSATNSWSPPMDLSSKGINFGVTITDLFATKLMDQEKYGTFVVL